MISLKLESVSKSFRKKQALKNVSCVFEPGITALLGPNGAGKSTLMNIICTLIRADSGAVFCNGQDITRQKEDYLGRISILFQNQPMYKTDTAMEYLSFCGALKGIPPAQVQQQGRELLLRFGIADTGKKRISAFSGGMRQRLALCGAFLGEPELILLDEPSAGLDIYEREELKRYLCELKKERTIIVSTHIVSDVEHIADKIILLNEGGIHAQGTQRELIRPMEGMIWELPSNAGYDGPVYHANGKELTFAQACPCAGAVRKEADLTDVYFRCVKAR